MGIEAQVPSPDEIARLTRELHSTSAPDERFEVLGDLLFAVVALSRELGLDPEDALRLAGRRFVERVPAQES